MAEKLAQQEGPENVSRRVQGQTVFYPRAKVTLSVIFDKLQDEEIAESKVFNVKPRSITVMSNNYHEADTFSLEFESDALPITPELIRGGAVEIYLFQAQGLGELPQGIKAPDDNTGVIRGLNPTIVGLFDEVGIEMSSDGRITTIDGTDYTSLFIARQWAHRNQPLQKASGDGKGRIKTGKNLLRTLEELLAQVPTAGAMSVRIEGRKADGSFLSEDDMPIVGRFAGKSKKSKGISVKDGSNYWDVMYRLAITHGHIIFVRSNHIILTTPQAFFRDRSISRKMAWGKNLTSLRMTRRIGKVQVPVIEVRSYNSKTRQTISGRFPKSKKQNPVTGLGTKRNEIQIVNIPNIQERKQLEAIARVYYDTIARGEQSVLIETMDLRDLEGTDLLELRAGDAISIGFDPFNESSVLIEGQAEGQRTQTLINLGYNPQVAAAISTAFDRINLFKRPFRVKEVTFEYSHDGGISIQAELQNYINIENQGSDSEP